MSDNQH